MPGDRDTPDVSDQDHSLASFIREEGAVAQRCPVSGRHWGLCLRQRRPGRSRFPDTIPHERTRSSEKRVNPAQGQHSARASWFSSQKCVPESNPDRAPDPPTLGASTAQLAAIPLKYPGCRREREAEGRDTRRPQGSRAASRPGERGQEDGQGGHPANHLAAHQTKVQTPCRLSG